MEQRFNSEREINDGFKWLLESLITSGIQFDESALRLRWSRALLDFRSQDLTDEQ